MLETKIQCAQTSVQMTKQIQCMSRLHLINHVTLIAIYALTLELHF